MSWGESAHATDAWGSRDREVQGQENLKAGRLRIRSMGHREGKRSLPQKKRCGGDSQSRERGTPANVFSRGLGGKTTSKLMWGSRGKRIGTGNLSIEKAIAGKSGKRKNKKRGECGTSWCGTS